MPNLTKLVLIILAISSMTISSISNATSNAEIYHNKLASLRSSLLRSLSNPNSRIQSINYYKRLNSNLKVKKGMVFINMPSNQQGIDDATSYLASLFKSFQTNKIEPLIVVEPSNENGPISFDSIANGEYNNNFDLFFNSLANKYDSTKLNTTWVPFPEPNIPNTWNNNNFDVRSFGYMFNNFSRIQKSNLSNSKSTILLNNKTYDSNDINWSNGEYKSFTGYIENIDKGLIDSFGIQGFAWNYSNPTWSLKNAKTIIQSSLLTEAAQTLGLKSIWANTGTDRFFKDNSIVYEVSNRDRNQINTDLSSELVKFTSQGYNVEVNLFLEDKLNTNEGRDWSYYTTNEDRKVFSNFTNSLQRGNVSISIF